MMLNSCNLKFEDLAPQHHAELAAFFNALVVNGDQTFFYPHPLTENESKKLCSYEGLDCYLVAKSDGRIIGYGMLRGWDEGYEIPSLGLAVHPDHRSKGVAAEIMKILILRAQKRGAHKLRLTVDSRRLRFIKFFERFGFKFSTGQPGRLVGLLEITQPCLVDKPRVGICADVLVSWAGGRDLLVNLLRAMKVTEPDSVIWLLAPGPEPTKLRLIWSAVKHAAKNTVKALIGRPRLSRSPEETRAGQVTELIEKLRAIDPRIGVQYMSGLDEKIAESVTHLQLDVVIMAMRRPSVMPACALIGYVPDYQHQHLPNLFSVKERDNRDLIFRELISCSDAMFMHAHAVAADMRHFTEGQLPSLYVLPYAPSLNPEWLSGRSDLLKRYIGAKPYFVICNQFWMHKDHRTAFLALAKIAKNYPEVSMVCTGGKTDYRDPDYFRRIETEIRKLGLDEKIIFVGHIPKRDQIELLKHAIALVQPTLCEGGPGGGSTYEAIALGQRVLLSDLPVNRELDQGDIKYFQPGDHLALAKLMEFVLNEPRVTTDEQSLLNQNQQRIHRYGNAIWRSINEVISARSRR